jgi:hypothetical protein
VTPQPGGFYGGWITSHVAGPFKGIPRKCLLVTSRMLGCFRDDPMARQDFISIGNSRAEQRFDILNLDNNEAPMNTYFAGYAAALAFL